MADLVQLAAAVRQAEGRLHLTESRSQQLSELASSGRWEGLYEKGEFQQMCAQNEKERKEETVAFNSAETKLREAALRVGGNIGNAITLVQKARTEEQVAYDKMHEKFAGNDKANTYSKERAATDKERLDRTAIGAAKSQDKQIDDWFSPGLTDRMEEGPGGRG